MNRLFSKILEKKSITYIVIQSYSVGSIDHAQRGNWCFQRGALVNPASWVAVAKPEHFPSTAIWHIRTNRFAPIRGQPHHLHCIVGANKLPSESDLHSCRQCKSSRSATITPQFNLIHSAISLKVQRPESRVGDGGNALCAIGTGGYVLGAVSAGGCGGRAACAWGPGDCALCGGGRGERTLCAGGSEGRAGCAIGSGSDALCAVSTGGCALFTVICKKSRDDFNQN